MGNAIAWFDESVISPMIECTTATLPEKKPAARPGRSADGAREGEDGRRTEAAGEQHAREAARKAHEERPDGDARDTGEHDRLAPNFVCAAGVSVGGTFERETH